MKEEKPNNPEAFPNAGDGRGMTLRDYFAGKAVKTAFDNVVRRCIYYAEEEHQKNYEIPHNEIAEQAYGIADAMLKAREEK